MRSALNPNAAVFGFLDIFSRAISPDRHLGHVRRYTKAELRKRFENAGLIFECGRYFNTATISGWKFSGSLLKDETVSEEKLRFFDSVVTIFKILDKMASRFMGIFLIASGIKNIN